MHIQLPPIKRDSRRLLVHTEEAVIRFSRYHKYPVCTNLRQPAMQIMRGYVSPPGCSKAPQKQPSTHAIPTNFLRSPTCNGASQSPPRWPVPGPHRPKAHASNCQQLPAQANACKPKPTHASPSKRNARCTPHPHPPLRPTAAPTSKEQAMTFPFTPSRNTRANPTHPFWRQTCNGTSHSPH